MARVHSIAARLFNRQALFATRLSRLSPEQASAWDEVARAARAMLWPASQAFSMGHVHRAFSIQIAIEKEFLDAGCTVEKPLARLRELLA